MFTWYEQSWQEDERSQNSQVHRKTYHVEPKYYINGDENSGGQLDSFMSPIYKEEWKLLLCPVMNLCRTSIVYMQVFLLHLSYLHLIVLISISRKVQTRSSIYFPQCLMRMKVYSQMIILECLQLHLIWCIRTMETFRNLIRCTVSMHHPPILSYFNTVHGVLLTKPKCSQLCPLVNFK